MYESPLEIVQKDYMQMYRKQVDASLSMHLETNYGINVAPEELMRALNYDRGQYEKGFADGVASVREEGQTCKWTKVEDALPERGGIYLTVFNFHTWGEKKKKYPLTCRYSVAAKHFIADGPVIGEISHWMEIPELEEEKNENQTDSRADKEA